MMDMMDRAKAPCPLCPSIPAFLDRLDADGNFHFVHSVHFVHAERNPALLEPDTYAVKQGNAVVARNRHA
jgi:hypothetical protein